MATKTGEILLLKTKHFRFILSVFLSSILRFNCTWFKTGVMKDNVFKALITQLK